MRLVLLLGLLTLGVQGALQLLSGFMLSHGSCFFPRYEVIDLLLLSAFEIGYEGCQRWHIDTDTTCYVDRQNPTSQRARCRRRGFSSYVASATIEVIAAMK